MKGWAGIAMVFFSENKTTCTQQAGTEYKNHPFHH
jgi:hypothetical protein